MELTFGLVPVITGAGLRLGNLRGQISKGCSSLNVFHVLEAVCGLRFQHDRAP